MANKWAVQNGNWSDGSTWNDGVVPTVDDDVYLNGKTVSVDITTIDAKNITNEPKTTIIAGGSLQMINSVTTIIVNSNLKAYSQHLLTANFQNAIVTINGNTVGDSSLSCAVALSNSSTITINGNVYEYSTCQLSNFLHTYINGDVFCNHNKPIRCYTGGFAPDFNINGTLHINTHLRDGSSAQITLYLIILNGSIIFYDDFTLSRNGNSIFGIIDLRNSTSVKFPFIGQTSIDASILYPYSQNIPESVVLEGYRYDNNSKIGTLKTVPDNVAIVNLTEQEVNRVKNCATVSTVQKCFEDFKEE